MSYEDVIWFFQKLFRGYSDCDLWDLDHHLVELILPRLKAFKKININGYPGSLKNMKEWHKIIDKMIWSFENWNKDDYCFEHYGDMKTEELPNGNHRIVDLGCKMDKKKYNNHWQKVNEGMDLFRKYFFSLWD